MALMAGLAGAPALAWQAPLALADPLNTRPPVLDHGAILPGDTQAFTCPAPEEAPQVPQPLALTDAVDLALCHNPQLQVAWAAIKRQSAALGEARAAYWPTLSTSLSRLHNRTVYPRSELPGVSNDGHTAYVGFTWRLFDFGGRAANRDAASQLVAAALAEHDATLQRVLSAAVGAYFDAISAQAVFTAKAKAAGLAQASLIAAQRREAKGASALSDTLQAKTALARAMLGQKRAEGEFRKTIAVLTYAIGLPAGSSLTLPEMPDADPSPIEAGDASGKVNDLSQWLAEARIRHPALLAARAQRDAARAKVQAVRSEGSPSIDLTGNFYQNGYPNQGLQSTRSNVTTVGISVSLPLFEGFSRTYKIHGAQAQAEQSEAQLQEIEDQLLVEIVKTHADALSSLENLQSSAVLLTAARAAVTSSERRYAIGAADILELLETQGSLAEAEQERIRCLADWRSARLRLLANSGLLGRGS